MTKIAWDESMTTGVPEIDAQHKELLEKFNELSDALDEHKDRQTAAAILDFLQFYSAWHFQREEACMEQYHCPMAELNRVGHAEFIAHFGQLYELYQGRGVTHETAKTVYEELRDWLVNHIRRVDSGLYPCVKGHQ